MIENSTHIASPDRRPSDVQRDTDLVASFVVDVRNRPYDDMLGFVNTYIGDDTSPARVGCFISKTFTEFSAQRLKDVVPTSETSYIWAQLLRAATAIPDVTASFIDDQSYMFDEEPERSFLTQMTKDRLIGTVTTVWKAESSQPDSIAMLINMICSRRHDVSLQQVFAANVQSVYNTGRENTPVDSYVERHNAVTELILKDDTVSDDAKLAIMQTRDSAAAKLHKLEHAHLVQQMRQAIEDLPSTEFSPDLCSWIADSIETIREYAPLDALAFAIAFDAALVTAPGGEVGIEYLFSRILAAAGDGESIGNKGIQTAISHALSRIARTVNDGNDTASLKRLLGQCSESIFRQLPIKTGVEKLQNALTAVEKSQAFKDLSISLEARETIRQFGDVRIVFPHGWMEYTSVDEIVSDLRSFAKHHNDNDNDLNVTVELIEHLRQWNDSDEKVDTVFRHQDIVGDYSGRQYDRHSPLEVTYLKDQDGNDRLHLYLKNYRPAFSNDSLDPSRSMRSFADCIGKLDEVQYSGYPIFSYEIPASQRELKQMRAQFPDGFERFRIGIDKNNQEIDLDYAAQGMITLDLRKFIGIQLQLTGHPEGLNNITREQIRKNIDEHGNVSGFTIDLINGTRFVAKMNGYKEGDFSIDADMNLSQLNEFITSVTMAEDGKPLELRSHMSIEVEITDPNDLTAQKRRAVERAAKLKLLMRN